MFLTEQSFVREEHVMGISDRRRYQRFSSTCPVVARDLHGQVVARGRTSNASANGAFVIAPMDAVPSLGDQLLIEMKLLRSGGPHTRRGPRRAHYLARVVRLRQIGQLVGLGMELTEQVVPRRRRKDLTGQLAREQATRRQTAPAPQQEATPTP